MSFQVGNVVKVGAQGVTNDPNGMGEGKPWQNAWVATQDINVGMEFTIVDIDPTLGVFFEEEDSDNLHGGYGYPLNVLELVATTAS